MELGAADMFQKLAIAFKSKTFDFFTDEHDQDFIPDQKLIIIKPDLNSTSQTKSQTQSQSQNTALIVKPFNTHFGNYLISSAFALISSFEASYLQLQTAHVPFDEEQIIVNDKLLVNRLQKMCNLRGVYIDSRKNPGFNIEFGYGSCLEPQVNENQSKLRGLETMFNRLQADIDGKDDKVSVFRKELREIEEGNLVLSKRLNPANGFSLRIGVFESLLRDVCRLMRRFSKCLIRLMKKAGYDLDLVASYVHPNVGYAKRGNFRYVFLSYVCLGMFQGFDSKNFGLVGSEDSNNDDSMELFEHVSVNPLETLNKNPDFPFSKFCERKYEGLVHPTMESSIFKNLDMKKEVMDSWRSVTVFYDAFVNMSSSIWLLHKLARLFDPPVEIFQVEKGVDFSMVYMEDVTKKLSVLEMGVSKVGFTVIPGFKIGRTVVQSQVYLTGPKSTK